MHEVVAAQTALAALTGRDRLDALVVLGSGWGPAADAFGTPERSFPMVDIPGVLAPTAEGHGAEARVHDVDGVATLVLLGRTHLYEGHGLRPVVAAVRAAGGAGARLALLTNANGSLRDDWAVGRAVLVSDHLNQTGTSPLEGAARSRHVDLTDAWSPRLRALARTLDPTLDEGVYAWLRGPHYETWAEAEWLRRVGADMLGMSTVPEAIAAREWGMEVLGLSTVTAIEGPGAEGTQGIDPSEVVAVAERTAARLGPLLVDLVRKGART
ncbi:purine-nucleoside phosphorylase [Nocardioides iriomotensis]|uniref:Purine nucleoside phosphorylase n=1 Tax=Nocardioides iriomotensis TaxID=715784 RepID=A0A4Q5IT17_9ACTN|nr:purine-nucleoside phosphorylase [Nocardioides iriomotensis]RYU08823.1 purine-nucleoside phosphorylase [Nocardioides iriomotensis]